MKYAKKYELLLRYNYFIDLHPIKAMIIIFIPYLISLSTMFIFPDYKIKFIPLYILSSLFVIVSMILRQTDITFSLNNDSKKMYERRSVLSNKWLRRGTSRFIYIKPIDNMHINIYHYNIPESYQVQDLMLPEFSSYKSHWGEWNMSSTIPASKQDIEKHNLSWLEAKILLGQENG